MNFARIVRSGGVTPTAVRRAAGVGFSAFPPRPPVAKVAA
jgi:hypothetical protein